MTLPNLRNLLLRPFRLQEGYCDNPYKINPFSLVNMGMSIEIPLGYEIQCPICLLEKVKQRLEDTSAFELQTTTAVQTVSISDTTSNRRTASTIISDLFSCNNFAKVVTNKGKVYYGTSGIVLDENMKLLFILSCHISISLEEEKKITSIDMVVSPSVFQNQEDLVCKAIIRDIIPIYLEPSSNETIIRYLAYYSEIPISDECCGISVIVKNMEDIIVSPQEPVADNPSEALTAELAASISVPAVLASPVDEPSTESANIEPEISESF